LKSAKECVTTHLPNELALKMDGAEAGHRCCTVVVNPKLQRVGGREGSAKASDVNLGGIAFSADLGGSSNYSNVSFEGRSGVGFHVNSIWTWVSRS
jgi:hypothetical protein